MNTTPLTEAQVEAYWRDGFLCNLPALTPDEAAAELAKLEAIEAQLNETQEPGWKKQGYRPWDHGDDHPLFVWAKELVTHPAVLAAASSVLGPDLLVRNADIFVKEPKTRQDIGWHRDTAEKGEETDGILTMWLGLTASTERNGCLKYAPGTHRGSLPDGPKDKFSLTLTKRAVSALPLDQTTYNVMEPGSCSMHHIRLVHGSDPNRTRERRIGFVVRWMSPKATPEIAESGIAFVAQGSGAESNFTLRDTFPMTWTG